MDIDLSAIIVDALPLVESQVGEKYDIYAIEKDFRMHNPRPGTSFPDAMPDVVESWSVSECDILLIECLYHDMHTRCHKFASVSELEGHILGGSSFLNWLVSYIVPVVNGAVMAFDVYTEAGEKIVKHVFDETSTSEMARNCRIRWRS